MTRRAGQCRCVASETRTPGLCQPARATAGAADRADHRDARQHHRPDDVHDDKRPTTVAISDAQRVSRVDLGAEPRYSALRVSYVVFPPEMVAMLAENQPPQAGRRSRVRGRNLGKRDQPIVTVTGGNPDDGIGFHLVVIGVSLALCAYFIRRGRRVAIARERQPAPTRATVH